MLFAVLFVVFPVVVDIQTVQADVLTLHEYVPTELA